jgi:hypothetical protein
MAFSDFQSLKLIRQAALRMIFTMLKNNKPYHDRAVDNEALSVKKNAPRWLKSLKKYGLLPVNETTATKSPAFAA